MRALLFAAALVAAACTPAEYQCQGDRECVSSHGNFGLCIDQHCAYKDTQCAGGFRFDDTGGAEANQCVDVTKVQAHLDAGVIGIDAAVGVVDAGVADGPLADGPVVMVDAGVADAASGG